MSYRFEPDEPVINGVRRIAREQINKAIRTIDASDSSTPNKVHDVRKRCKKLRGVVRIVRPSFPKVYQQENAWFRDTARQLSQLRDAKVMQSTYDLLMEHYAEQVDRAAFASVRRALTAERGKLVEREDPQQLLQHTRERLQQAADRSEDWTIDHGGYKAISAGLSKTYGRAQAALGAATKDPSPERLHELRKRIKYHWHHCRLLQGVWTPVLKARRVELKRLADLLGDDHDLAVLGEHVEQSPDQFADPQTVTALAGLINQRRKQIQQEAVPLARRLLAETPDELSARFRTYWKIWRAG